MAEQVRQTKEVEFNDLLTDAFNLATQDNSLHNFFISAAIRSKSRGQDAITWTRYSEAYCKSYFANNRNELILRDSFILSLALKLSSYYESSFDEVNDNTTEKLN
jgi:hypothetical protein